MRKYTNKYHLLGNLPINVTKSFIQKVQKIEFKPSDDPQLVDICNSYYLMEDYPFCLTKG